MSCFTTPARAALLALMVLSGGCKSESGSPAPSEPPPSKAISEGASSTKASTAAEPGAPAAKATAKASAPAAKKAQAAETAKAKLDPDLEERLRVGIQLNRGEKFAEAQAWFEKMAKERPDSAAAHYNLGWLHDRAGRLEASIGSYRKSIELDREHPRAYNNLGYSLQKAGRSDEAIDTWIEGIARVPDNEFAKNNLKKLIGQLRCKE